MRTLFALLVIGILTLAMLPGCTMEQTMNGGGTATNTDSHPIDSNNNTTLPPATTPTAE